MSASNNGQAPPFSRGLELDLEWRGQRLTCRRPTARAHNTWTPLIHQWPEIAATGEVPDALLEATLAALDAHVLKADGREVESVESFLVAPECGDLLIQLWLAAMPRGLEPGESDAPRE